MSPAPYGLSLVSPNLPLAQILNGRSWVIVDGAVLDVSTFAKRHPGGARIIINAMGTDITAEILGESTSIGNSKSAFAPHTHTDVSSCMIFGGQEGMHTPLCTDVVLATLRLDFDWRDGGGGYRHLGVR